MDLEDLPENSDTSDDDYVPEGEKSENIPSEEDSDGDSEEPLSESEDVGQRRKKRRKKSGKGKKKSKKDMDNGKVDEKATNINENDKKKKEEDIWADFMKDTDFQSRSNIKTQVTKSTKPVEEKVKIIDNVKDSKIKEKVKVTQIFDFAGEEVKVEKEVLASSAEARLLTKSNEISQLGNTSKRGSLSGIGSVLSQLGKKPKISTLEKSKLDWDRFKKEENLEEELQTYNKGKNGYLDKQDFLQRADLRRFEIEKEIRSVERSKRFNSTL